MNTPSLPKMPGLGGTNTNLKFAKPYLKRKLTTRTLNKTANNSLKNITQGVSGMVSSGLLKMPKITKLPKI